MLLPSKFREEGCFRIPASQDMADYGLVTELRVQVQRQVELMLQ